MSECTCHKNYTLDTLIPKVGVITDIRQETPDVKTFRVEAPEGGKLFEHMPGQCAMVCAPGVSEGMFSITSSPTVKDYQEFSIKKCGSLTDYLHSLQVGDEIAVRGPYGNHFPVEDKLKGKNLLFIAGGIGLAEDEIKDISQIYIVACGSAYHVGMAAQYVIEDMARIPVRVELASEFRYRNPILDPHALAIVISQSGETADSLAALRLCKDHGIRTLAIVNVVGSSIAREADNVFYTLAGPEISVATTKAYSTQMMASYVLAIQFALVREQITEEQYTGYIKELQTLPEKIQRIIDDKERIQWFASKQANAHDTFFVGRGIDYAISMEGSLKMKEVSYIHSEAYAAGELKHGTISLIEDGTLVIGVLTQPDLYEKTVSNMVECKSRGAYLMGMTTFGNYNIEDTADFTVYIPKTDPYFATSLAVIPLQLLGYYVSVAKGLDVDKPRNLAKSVTVE